MPVTIPIASHPSNPYAPPVPSPTSPQTLLEALGKEYACVDGGVIQESVPESDLEYLTPHRNGFLRAVLDAYSGHHHLVLRPDDVWITIVTQLKYYFQSHPEVATQHFLPDQATAAGKRAVPINYIGAADTVNIAIIANQMTREVQTQIADPSFREFVLPTFSTTSIEDKIICTVLMLSTMDSLFDVSLAFMCGIPSLTLLGTESDWSDMLERVRPIATEGRFGNEARHWGSTLVVVLEKFVDAFSTKGEDKEFWGSIVRYSRGAGEEEGGGVIGGWITAFARWGPHHSDRDASGELESLVLPSDASSSSPSPNYIHKSLKFPTLNPTKLPSAIATLDFPLTDEGKEKPARLIAGHVGKTWFGVQGDTVQPCPVWMLYLPKPLPAPPSPPQKEESATDRMRKAVNVMMRSRKKSTVEEKEKEKEKTKEREKEPSPPLPSLKVGALGAGVASPGTAVGKAAVASSEEEKSRWHRLVQHTRKLSETRH